MLRATRALACAVAVIAVATAAGPLRVRPASAFARPLAPRRSRPLLSSNAPAAAPPSSATGTRLLWADKLSRANDGKIFQFKGASTQLLSGQRLGLVGPNGCGERSTSTRAQPCACAGAHNSPPAFCSPR